MWNDGICHMIRVDDAEVLSKNTPCVRYAGKLCNTSVYSVVQNLKECYIRVMRMMCVKQEIRWWKMHVKS